MHDSSAATDFIRGVEAMRKWVLELLAEQTDLLDVVFGAKGGVEAKIIALQTVYLNEVSALISEATINEEAP